MPTYLTPGVYIEEAPSKQTPIEGVGTSVAAFIGLAAGGPLNDPQRISSWSQFERLFSHPADPERGPWLEGAYMPHAVYGYFQNGGSTCWIVRVGEDDGGRPRALLASENGDGQVIEAVAREEIGAGPVTVKVSAEPAAPDSAEDGDGDD